MCPSVGLSLSTPASHSTCGLVAAGPRRTSLEKGWGLLQLGAHLDWLPRGHLPPWAVRVLFSELGLPVTGHRSGNGWA